MAIPSGPGAFLGFEESMMLMRSIFENGMSDGMDLRRRYSSTVLFMR